MNGESEKGSSTPRNPWDDVRKLEAMAVEIRTMSKYYGCRLVARHAVSVLDIARLEVDYVAVKLDTIALSGEQT